MIVPSSFCRVKKMGRQPEVLAGRGMVLIFFGPRLLKTRDRTKTGTDKIVFFETELLEI